MANDERPISLPFVRSPSDVAHDRIKGEYTAEDAVTPGEAVGEKPEDTRDAGLIDGHEDVRIQDADEAEAAETRRRVEDMSSVELDEAEARDEFARRLNDEDEGDNIPAVGGNPEANTNESGSADFDFAAGSEAAEKVAVEKGKDGGENDAEPVLVGEAPDEDESEDESDESTEDDDKEGGE